MRSLDCPLWFGQHARHECDVVNAPRRLDIGGERLDHPWTIASGLTPAQGSDATLSLAVAPCIHKLPRRPSTDAQSASLSLTRSKAGHPLAMSGHCKYTHIALASSSSTAAGKHEESHAPLPFEHGPPRQAANPLMLGRPETATRTCGGAAERGCPSTPNWPSSYSSRRRYKMPSLR